MMTEIWWKVFLASIITTVILKLLRNSSDIFLLFSVSFLSWAAVLITVIAVSGWLNEKRKRNRH